MGAVDEEFDAILAMHGVELEAAADGGDEAHALWRSTGHQPTGPVSVTGATTIKGRLRPRRAVRARLSLVEGIAS